MIKVDQMLFFTFSYLVCLVIDKHDFFIFYKISIDDSLYQNSLLTIPVFFDIFHTLCKYKWLFSV